MESVGAEPDIASLLPAPEFYADEFEFCRLTVSRATLEAGDEALVRRALGLSPTGDVALIVATRLPKSTGHKQDQGDEPPAVTTGGEARLPALVHPLQWHLCRILKPSLGSELYERGAQ